MTYQGNPSLAAPVKDRVTSTFHQTLALYRQGRVDEVAAGCNLILQMDPQFEPARKLLEAARNPSIPFDPGAYGAGEPDAPTMAAAREAMAGRDFQRVIQITTEILTNDLMNDEARILADEARERQEAGPFIDQFVRKCDQNLASGNMAGAKSELEKARALDPTHPEVLRVAKAIESRASAPAPAPPPPPAPSFIIDDTTQQATGRAAAPASDFGFTFEEDKPQETSFANFSFDAPSSDSPFAGGFSFDTPAATPTVTLAAPPAPAPADGGFDFSTASITTSPDDQKKIEQYLSDGDRAFEAEDYQQAIDLWSRIFLIDVTNDQASERIERAKAKRRQIEQKVEALIASGTTALDRGDTARARAEFAEALRLDPNNDTAQEAMDRLTSGVTEGGAAAVEETFVPPPMDDKIDLGFFEDEPSSGAEGSLVPPEPGAAPAAPAKKSTGSVKARPAAAAKKSPLGLIAAVVGLLVILGGGWFVWSRFMSKPDVDPAATEAIFARASSLAGRGKFDEAIAALQEIQPDDPQHDKALLMISDLQQKKTKSAEMIDGIPIAQYFERKLSAARTAYAAHDYATAKIEFENAQRARPLPPDAKTQYDHAAEQVAKLDAAKALFAEQKYSEAITNLQPLLAEDPQNANVQRMIVDAHFNLGATALQENRLADAIKAFDEVLKVTPNDELARRSRELAVRYNGEKPDLLYQIYVKYLPRRRAA
jgi:tetratricopeptide (TPR) repeat protein